MFVVGVYVTSRYKNYPEFKVTLDEALKKYLPTGKPNALCTGSSKSNGAGNGLVRKYAFENGIPCRVFETQWANNIPTKPGKKNTAGVRSNAMIIRNSNACVLFWTPTSVAKWDFMSGGCYNFRKMCGKMRRELIEIKADIYKPIDNDIGDEPIRTLPERSDNDGAMSAAMPTGGAGAFPSGYGASVAAPAPHHTTTATHPTGGGFHMGGSASPPDEMPTDTGGIQSLGSAISEIPVDINGDGAPDTSITAIDTTGDGLPDSQLTPVDADGNGTVDGIEITPLPQNGQQSAADVPPSTQTQDTQPPPQGGSQPQSVETDDGESQQ